MAKEQPHEDPNSSDGSQSESQQDGDINETIHEESLPEESPRRPSGESTLVPAEEDAASSAESSNDELEKTLGNDDLTVQLDATVSVEATVDGEAIEEALDKTVDGLAIDQTMPVEASGAVDAADGGKKKSHATVKAGGGERTVQGRDSSMDIVATAGSIMASSDISFTVNPRDLSAEDLEVWNVRAGKSKASLPMSADRTIADEQLQRLRKCDVAEVQADSLKAADYKLVGKLGQGGMGDVYAARQGSLDRVLALKVIKPLAGRRRAQLVRSGKLESVEKERKQQFLSEAIVTSDLDHPNIVPIHDVALTSEGDLFYSMKRVAGTPWSDVIHEKTQDENLEILLKACDAIAFAHTRGVVHRDIKPENIMLGDFGVVLVMDWGLALPTSEYEKQDSIFMSMGLGGTPAFMAPELATGPLEKITASADVYLLGATLYMIITGVAPHHAKSISKCLMAVKENSILPVREELQSDLVDVAMKAMATEPEDRYPDVPSFQQAIRDYRAHAESVSLAARAAEDLEKGRYESSYSDLSRAAFRFEEAIKSWSGNLHATAGLAETKGVHALAALENGDLDLGLSLLDESNLDHRPIIEQLRRAYQERELRQSKFKLMRNMAVAMLVFILVGGAVSIYVINGAKVKADVAKDSARKSAMREKAAKVEALASANREKLAKEEALASADREKKAKEEALASERREVAAKEAAVESQMQAELAEVEESKARKAAEQNAELARIAKVEAEMQKRVAVQARDEAEVARAEAEHERERAHYEQYVSMIGLAKARLERNEVDGAREILVSLRMSPQFRDQIDRWEWRWLWHQSNQSFSVQANPAPISDMGLAASGTHALVTLTDGSVQRMMLSDAAELSPPEPFTASDFSAYRATCVAVDSGRQIAAVGTQSGAVLIFDSGGSLIRTISMHRDRVNDLKFSNDGLLVTGSDDRTVRIWDEQSASELTSGQAAYHISAVRQIAVAGDRRQLRIAVAISDDVTGQVVIWNAMPKSETDPVVDAPAMRLDQMGTMSMHRDPVTSVAIASDGERVASGDLGGNVWLWNPASATVINYEDRIRQAIDLVQSESKPTDSTVPVSVPTVPLIDLSLRETRQSSTAVKKGAAHADVVRSLQFSGDGSKLVTCSDDYTVKMWNTENADLEQTLKGHGGWVVAAGFLRGQAAVIVSASNDGTVRSWWPEKYVSAAVVHGMSDVPALRQSRAHRDEILSAAFSRDGNRVVTASHDHTARVMEIDPNNLGFSQAVRLQEEVLEEGTSYVAMSIGMDRLSNRLFIGSADATIRIWDIRLGTKLHEARGTGINTSFAISNDGRYLLTGSSGQAAKALLWQLDPNGNTPPQIVHRLKLHEQAVTAFAISPDSTLMFTADRSGFGVLWNLQSGEPIGDPVETVRGFRVNEAAFTVDGKQLLLAADDEQLTVIDVATRKTTQRLGHDGLVTQVVVAGDGQHAITVSEGDVGDKRASDVRLWDLSNGQSVLLDRASESIVRAGDKSTSGQHITSANFGESPGTIVVSRSVGKELPSSVHVFSWTKVVESPGQEGPSLAFELVRTFELPSVLGSAEAVISVDENRLVTMNRNGGFLWGLDSQRLLKSYRAHAALTEACFSADGKFVATASRSLKIWDAATGQALAKLESERPITTVQFAPGVIADSQYALVTGDMDGNVRLWNWDDKAGKVIELRQLSGTLTDDNDAAAVRRVRFSSTGERLVAVGDGGMIHLWNTADWSDQVDLPAPEADYTCAAFSTDGSILAAGAKDKIVRTWVLGDQPIGKPVELIGHADQITGVAVLGDAGSGVRVVTSSVDDTARVWDPRGGVSGQGLRGREILSLRRHTGDVTSVDATIDGRMLMTSGRDGKVILWPAGPVPSKRMQPK
ncbi:MAG: protein kinase [Rubripirellula sp.]|nr:protein kinase [Rubripirellula sp.]